MPDGSTPQIPNVQIPDIKVPNILGQQQNQPLPYRFSVPVGNQTALFGPNPINTDPNIYDIDKVAYQSGFTNVLNSFLQGVNQTTISASQYDLYNVQKQIAEIEGGNTFKGKLQDLDTKRLTGELSPEDYKAQKSQLTGTLNSLYSQAQKINQDISTDQGDINNDPVSKQYKMKEQQVQSLGYNAGLGEKLFYSQPNAMGSSFATMGSTLLTAFGSDFAKKLGTRVAASLDTGPAAPWVAAGLTILTSAEVLYQARALESKSEVGGQISDDLNTLTQDYLQRTGKDRIPGYQLTQQEKNDLLMQAMKGADTQYWKNMSLAAMDAAQSVLIGGTFGKWFENLSKLNKFTRLGVRAGEWYLESKGEEVEEGLQFAYQKEKSRIALNNEEDATGENFLQYIQSKGAGSFINGLRQDYVDVLTSLNLGPIKGNGKYSNDPEFQFSADSGFIMGILMGGGSGIINTVKDIHGYRQAASALQKAGVENAEGNVFKFKSQLYKSFFDNKPGFLGNGLTSQEAEDRFHYLREGIKALGNKTDANGVPILTKEEVRNEVANIDVAFEHYNKINGYLDNIKPGLFNPQQKAMYKAAAAKFSDAAFQSSMQRVNSQAQYSSALSERTAALNGVSQGQYNLLQAKADLDAIDNRIKQVNNLQIGEDLRNKKIADLQSYREEAQQDYNNALQTYKEAGFKVSDIDQVSPELANGSYNLLTARMFKDEANEKYNNLLKIKSFKNLTDWFVNTSANEQLEGYTQGFEAIQRVKAEGYQNIRNERNNRQGLRDDIQARRQAAIDSLGENPTEDQLKAVNDQFDNEAASATDNPTYEQLTDTEKKSRDKENKDILAQEGFTKDEINRMDGKLLDETVNDIIDTYSRGEVYVNENKNIQAMANLKSNSQFKGLFNTPGFEQFLKRKFPNLTKDSDYTDVVKAASDVLDNQKQNRQRKPGPTGPATNQVVGRSRGANDIRTSDELETAVGVKDGQASQKDVLNYIIDNPYATAAEKELARQFLKITDNTDVITFEEDTAPGSYRPDIDKVNIDLRYIGDEYERNANSFESVALHELVHKYTINTLKGNKDLSDRLDRLFEFVSDQARKKGVFDRYYGLNNREELLTEAFTGGDEFQGFLKGLSYNAKQSVWDAFLQLVNDALKALGIRTNQTTLDEVLSIGTNLIDRSSRESFTAIRDRFADTLKTLGTADTNEYAQQIQTEVYKSLYDIKDTLSPAEFDILQGDIDAAYKAASDRIARKDKDNIKFGNFNLVSGNFIVLKDRKGVFVAEKQAEDKSLIVSYKYKPKGSKETKTGTRAITPEDVAGVFSSRDEAQRFLQGQKAETKTDEAPSTFGNDPFAGALSEFINYTQQKFNIGALDPRLIELGNKLINEGIKIGKNSFKSISEEVLTRAGDDQYRVIFNNLRAVYSALFADLQKNLVDTESEMTNLVMGRVTAQSMIDDIRQQPTPTTNTFTNPQDAEAAILRKKNIDDRITGQLAKSTGQQFATDADGNWTGQVDADPVKVRYYNFLDWANQLNRNLSDYGIFGMLVQDGLTLPDGTPIPHEQNTIDFINKNLAEGKSVPFGQIVVLVGKDNKPLRFNQKGEIDPSGNLITFNIESSKRILGKAADIVAKVNNMSTQEATIAIEQQAQVVTQIKDAAKNGKQTILDIQVHPGVPVFTTEQNSLSNLAGKNLEIEIANVRKDDTNLGYFTNHPNDTGLIGGAYVFLNGTPVKIEPSLVAEKTADLVVAMLAEQDPSALGTDEVKARTKFLNELVFQKFSKEGPSFYFKGKDIYLNGAKVDRANQKQVLLQNGRYNIVSYLLNKSWIPYVIKEGKVQKGQPINYNQYILGRSTSNAVINERGNQALGNSYVTYKINRQVDNWQPQREIATATPTAPSVPSSFTETFRAKNIQGGKPISLAATLKLVDFAETGLDGLDDTFKMAESITVMSIQVDEDGSRTGSFYVYFGEGNPANNFIKNIVLTKLPSNIQPNPVEQIEAKPIINNTLTSNTNESNSVKTEPSDSLAAKKQALKEKLAQQNQALTDANKNVDDDISKTMTSLGRSITYQRDTTENVGQEELDWFASKFSKSYTGENATRELRITSALVNSNLWGQFTENGINLFKNAPKGTLYHESFHEFTQMYLTLDEKRDLYNEARKLDSSLKTKSDFDVEEVLAEKFRQYVLSDGKAKLAPKAKNIFQRIWNYIKNILMGENSVDATFAKLYKGDITQYNPNINNIQFKKLNSGIVDQNGNNLFDITRSLAVVRSIDRIIYDFIHSYNKSLVDVFSEPKIVDAAYKFAYKAFSDKLVALRQSFESKIDAVETEEEFNSLSSELEKQTDKFNRIIGNWNDVMGYHQEHSRTFIIKGDKITFMFDEDGGIIDESDDTNSNRAKNNFEGLTGNEISSIEGSNKETKALVRGLGKATVVDGNVVPATNEFGFQELVDFGSTWNNLAINLNGLMEFSAMTEKLAQLSESFPEYKELLTKLDRSVDLSTNQISQIAKFRQDFSRTYVGVYELVLNPEDGTYRFLEGTKNNINAIESSFSDTFSNYPVGQYVARDEYGSNVVTKAIKNISVDKPEGRVQFLNAIGITLSEGTKKDPSFSDVVSGRAISAMKNSLVKLIDAGIKVTDPINQLKQPYLDLQLPGEAGNINKIVQLESKYNRTNASASMLNAEGSTVYALSLNNLLTISNSYLSNAELYPRYQDVVGLPHMAHLDFRNNPYVKNSIWLNAMFNLDENDPNFGERKKINGNVVTLDILNYNGLKVQQEQGASDGATTTGLWIGDKLVQDFNSLLTSGQKEMMRAGDKASAYSVKINGYSQLEGREDKLPIKIDSFINSYGGVAAANIFGGYLADELTRIQRLRYQEIGTNLDTYNKLGKNFSLFNGILSDELKEKILSELKADTDVDVLVSTYMKDLRNSLRDFFAKQVEDKVKSFTDKRFDINLNTWVDSTLRQKYNMSTLLRAYVVNAFILNVEQTKIFNGDGAFYKAFHKRNSKDTSTGTTMMTDEWFLNRLNEDKNSNLQAKTLGVDNKITNVTNTVVFKDNVVPSAYTEIYRKQLTELGIAKDVVDNIVSKYEDANEGDAQGWITLDFYRTFKLAQGKWYPEHEVAYVKASNGEALSEEEQFYFMPIKAQYAGPLQYEGAFAPAFHKFSLVPLLPSVIKGTKMEAMNEKMIRNNVGYGLFESGSKVATILDENGKKEQFYQDYKERTAVDPSTTFKQVNPIFNHYLKEQVNIEPELHDEVIFGTQFRKLLFQNLFNEGQSLNEKWDALYNQYSNVIDKLVTNEKQRLLEELGMAEDSNGNYRNVDFTKLVDKFVKEADRRDMNINVRNFMEYDKDSKSFRYPLDASVNRQQIQNMIMSIINNRIVRQHMSGDMMVQVSSAGFEKYTKPTDAQVEQYGTNGLRFYHLQDGVTQSMQVKVPLTGDFKNLLYFEHTDGNRIETLERLNEALKSKEWMDANKKSVSLLGYRIPTQGLNSIEFMEIAEFLPEEAGDIMILPTEIVTKAGSDFDIDKLSIFKPSIRTQYRYNKETKERTVENARYVEGNENIELNKSIETQKEEADSYYGNKINNLKDQINKVRDSKILDMKYYTDLKSKLRSDLKGDVNAISDDYIDVNYKIREKQLELTFLKDDRDQFKEQSFVNTLTEDQQLELADLNSRVNTAYQELKGLYGQRDQLKQAKFGAIGTMRALSDEADRIIGNYMDDYYSKIYDLQGELQSVQSEYFNKLEELRSYKKGLQNRIIEIGHQVLSAKENFTQLITPNDTGLIKPMITDPGGIKQQNGYPLKTDYTGTAIYTEKTQEEKFLAGLVGKATLGIAAVNNTFTQMFQKIGLKLEGAYKIETPNNTRTTPTLTPLLSKSESGSIDMSSLYDEKGLLKSEFISQMMNAYVDVLNDDFIFYANAGLDVAPIIFYLKNQGVSTEKIMGFINHPAVKYYINQLQAAKSYVLKATEPWTYDTNFRNENGQPGSFRNDLYKSIIGQPKSKISDILIKTPNVIQTNLNYFTENHLLNVIPVNISKIGYIERQAILGYFLEAQEQAEILRKFQSSNNFDTSPAANPIVSSKYDLNKKEVLNTKFISEKYFDRMRESVIKPFNVMSLVSSMFNSLMPSTLSSKLIDHINSNTTRIDQETGRPEIPTENVERYQRTYTNDVLSFVFANYVTLDNLEGKPTASQYVNGDANHYSMFRYSTRERDGKTVKVDGRLATRIKNFKSTTAFAALKSTYPIIDQLRVDDLKRNDGFANVYIYRGEDTTDTQNSLIEQFTKLANFSDEGFTKEQQLKVRKLFRDLALFGFAQSGLNKSPISFTDIIPNELYTPLISRGLEAFQDDIAKRGFNTVIGEYDTKFRQNNPEIYGEKRGDLPSYRYKDYSLIKNTIQQLSNEQIKEMESKVLASFNKSLQNNQENISKEDSEKVDKIFKKYPNLDLLFNGNKELYNKYLESIFPNASSEFKGKLFFHGAPKPIRNNKFEITEGSTGKGLWFTKLLSYAKIAENRGNESEKLTYGVVLGIENAKHFYNSSGALLTQTPSKFNEEFDRNLYDAVVFNHPNKENTNNKTYNQVVVFDASKVHIIGDENDMNLASKFISEKNQGSLENNQENRIFYSRNAVIDNEVDDILRQKTDDSIDCNK